MGELGDHRNIPVFDTKLPLGLLVGFISSHLAADKLFLVNLKAITSPPKTCLLLEVKSTPAFNIKPRSILVVHTDDLDWYITSIQQGQMLDQNHYRIVSRVNVMARKIPYCTTNCIPIDFGVSGKLSY